MFAPAANVPSIRSRAIRLPPLSTTAITPVVFLLLASATAAAITRRAPSMVRDFVSANCACVRGATLSRAAAATVDLKIFIGWSPVRPVNAVRRRFCSAESAFSESNFRASGERDFVDVFYGRAKQFAHAPCLGYTSPGLI